ncbi:MAG TPA: YceI family protein [Gemmatimonadaceae bacterium]|nr:YceI family protein [Gemmatimonadaceae bacterium]
MSTTTWNIDPAHTEVGFAVRHLMISTVRGRFGNVSGSVVVDDDNPRNSKVDATVDIASIDTRQEMRDNHLRSPDFFDAEKYPTMRFVSKRIEGDTAKHFKIVGDLTIKDRTHEVTLDASLEGLVKDPWGGERAGYSVSGKLNRTDFNLLWNQVLEAGGVTVGEEVKLSIDVELVKQVAAASAAA